MDPAIIAAIVGALGTIIAALITVWVRRHKNSASREHRLRELSALGEAAPLFRLIVIVAFVLGMFLAAMGGWFVYNGVTAGATRIDILGQSIESTSAGLVAIFLGVVVVIFVTLRILKAIEAANKSREFTKNLGDLKELESLEKRSEVAELTETPPPSAAPSAEQLASVTLPPRNDFFTGRVEKLQELDETLRSSHKAALSGLGGTGKTQIALEYAHRHQEQYTHIFWIRAETDQDLKSGYVAVAHLLDLPGKDTRNPDDTVRVACDWFSENDGWLLVCDNADTPALLKPYLPRQVRGRVLLTARAQVFQEIGIPKPIEIKEMSPDDALAFLFRRAGRERRDDGETKAGQDLARELGYFPLALEQAAAFITAHQSGFHGYLTSYRNRRLALLNEFGPVSGEYPESVGTTWTLNFAEVEESSEASADLLRFSAFLSPDNIPLELLVRAGSELGPCLEEALSAAGDDPVALDKVLKPLTHYSLVRRNLGARSYSMHRLVQEVVRDRIGEKDRELWARRVVNAVNAGFPSPQYETWPDCQRLLPHALVVAHLVRDRGMDTVEAACLLHNIGHYLYHRAQYQEAEPLYKRSLAIKEKALGDEHPSVATTLNNLALLYKSQGRYDEAEPLYKRDLAIREKALGDEHPSVATTLNNLAGLYKSQGRYDEAEPLYQRSLSIKEKALGAEHPSVATTLNNLAGLYQSQGRYDEAEPLYKRDLAISEKALGAEHPDVATTLNNLAGLYRSQGRYDEAEPLYQRSLAISEKALGAEHPDVATTLNNLAGLYRNQGRYDEAEPLYKRALEIYEKALGPQHPNFATCLENYTSFLRKMGRKSEAEAMEERAKGIRAKRAAAGN